MLLDNWKVIRGKHGERGYYYTDIDFNKSDAWENFEEEFGENSDGMEIIPYEKWNTEEITEILENCMEDCNMHGYLYWPRMVLDSMNHVNGMNDNMKSEIMRNIMNEMASSHLY